MDWLLRSVELVSSYPEIFKNKDGAIALAIPIAVVRYLQAFYFCLYPKNFQASSQFYANGKTLQKL